jgi:hypothetical protein
MSDLTPDIREEETPVEIVERAAELPKNALDAAVALGVVGRRA